MKEPCNCGAPDCPRCFPYNWRKEKAQQVYENYVHTCAILQFDPLSFEKWFELREKRREEEEALAWEIHRAERGW